MHTKSSTRIQRLVAKYINFFLLRDIINVFYRKQWLINYKRSTLVTREDVNLEYNSSKKETKDGKEREEKQQIVIKFDPNAWILIELLGAKTKSKPSSSTWGIKCHQIGYAQKENETKRWQEDSFI